MDHTELRARARAYCRDAPDTETRTAAERLLETDDPQALMEAFGGSLSFGTAGLRAEVGVGTTRMNPVTVRRCVAALCAQLRDVDARAAEDGVCIAYDGRRDSERFARHAAEVACAMGFRVRRFDRPVPTPVLAFATSHTGAAAGVMVTASHNPPAYNGIKIFWRMGRQVLPPHDVAIAHAMQGGRPLPVASNAPAPELGQDQLDAYLDRVVTSLPAPDADAAQPRIAYTALCGVGAEVTRTLLSRLDVHDVHEVAPECLLDPTFAGLTSPNPEDPQALARVRALAERTESDLVLAHDPDADRLAVAVRHDGAHVSLTGDEVGCLLGDFVLGQLRESGAAVVVTTLVSSELLGRIAAAHGAHHSRVPTGVKWISHEGRQLAARTGARYVFGYEEAIGYCLPEVGDDKDGVAALGMLIRLWQAARAEGRSLVDELHQLYAHHGVHRTRQRSWQWAAPETRTRVLEWLRGSPPVQLAGEPASGTEPDSRAPELLVLRYGDALRVALRPSGTEPKLKAYLEAREPVSVRADLSLSLGRADKRLREAVEELDRYVAQAAEER